MRAKIFITSLIDQHSRFCVYLVGQSQFFCVLERIRWGRRYLCSPFWEFREFWCVPAKSAHLSASNDATLPALLASCAAASPSTSAPHYYADLIPSWPPGNVVCRFASCIPALHVGRGKVGSSHIIKPFIHPSIHQPTTFPLRSSQYRREAGCSLNKLSAHLKANVHIFGS